MRSNYYVLIHAAWLAYWAKRGGIPRSAIMNTMGKLHFHERAAEIVEFERTHPPPPTVEELLYQIRIRRHRDRH